jgi:hypothetical protein
MIGPRNGNDEGSAPAGAIVAGAPTRRYDVFDVAAGGELEGFRRDQGCER